MGYDWRDGKGPVHSIPLWQHNAHLAVQGALRNPASPGSIPINSPQAAAAMAPPAPVAPPFDPALEARRAAGEARRTTLLGDMGVDLQKTAQSYGFSYDPSTGAFGGFDPTNPYSQAALLMKTRNENLLRNTNSSSRTGQLYSGSRQVGESFIGDQYNRGYDTLRRGFEDYVTRYLRRKRDIQTLAPEDVANL